MIIIAAHTFFMTRNYIKKYIINSTDVLLTYKPKTFQESTLFGNLEYAKWLNSVSQF